MFSPPNQAPGPRRGDVKRKIFKGFANAIGSMLVGFKQKRTKAEAFSAQTRTPQLYLQVVTTQVTHMIDNHSCWCILFTRRSNFCSCDYRVYCRLILLFVCFLFFFFLISFFFIPSKCLFWKRIEEDGGVEVFKRSQCCNLGICDYKFWPCFAIFFIAELHGWLMTLTLFMFTWFLFYHSFWQFWLYEDMGCVIGCWTEWFCQDLCVVVGLDFFFVKGNPWKQCCEKFCWMVLLLYFWNLLLTVFFRERERERDREVLWI